jgi:hypothetical protein
VAGLASVGVLWVKKPELFLGRGSPLVGGASEPTLRADAGPQASRCVGTVRLRDLPASYEVLLRLGTTPFDTGPMPVGVRLELVATAPGHRAARLIVPADATWSTDSLGRRSLGLEAKLEPSPSTGWPEAPAGSIGGVGPAGRLHLKGTPAGTEIWLVLDAGTSFGQPLAVGCDTPQVLMVVDPTRPGDARRLPLDPAELGASTSQAPLELSVRAHGTAAGAEPAAQAPAAAGDEPAAGPSPSAPALQLAPDDADDEVAEAPEPRTRETKKASRERDGKRSRRSDEAGKREAGR